MRWRAAPGERVVLSGGAVLSTWLPVSDAAFASRLAPGARGKVMVADLAAHGAPAIGELVSRGAPPIEVFFRGERMPLAAYPSEGWLRIADVPQSGPKMLNPGLAREKRFDGVPVGRHFGRIRYPGDRPSGWSDANEIILHGYWTWDWSESYQRVARIDRAKREVSVAEPHHPYGYTRNQRIRFLNVLEEIDRPGEWCMDRKAGKIYFWPPAEPDPSDVEVSALTGPLLELDGVSDLSIEGFALSGGRGEGAVLKDCRRAAIDGCVFFNLGGTAVSVEGGSGSGVRDSDIFDVGMGGISLSGGDRKTLAAGGNFAANNHIHRFGRWVRTGQVAVRVSGVGQTVDHNLIHDAPHEAIYLSGNDHLIEYNEIHDVCLETGDSGALHTGRDWTWRGNVIRNNFFHDLKGPGLHGVMAVYLDDWASGFTVTGNAFVRSGRSVMIGGGRDNAVTNNIFIACSPSVHIDARGLGWAKYYFDGTTPTLFDGFQAVSADRPPYSERYPALKTLLEDEPALPKYNRIERNISVAGRWLDVYDANAFDLSIVRMAGNLIDDPIVCRRLKPGFRGWDPYYLNIDLREGYAALRNDDPIVRAEFGANIFLDAAPVFFDLVSGDYRIRSGSPAESIGFEPIPMDRIGLLKDVPRPGSPSK